MDCTEQFLYACEKGDFDNVRYLLTSPDLKYHANIHAKSGMGFRLACKNGHLDIVKYLLTSPELEKHARIHVCNDCGYKWACSNGHLDIVTYLMLSKDLKERVDIDDGLQWAYRNGHLDVVTHLAQQGNFFIVKFHTLMKLLKEIEFINIIQSLSQEQIEYVYKTHFEKLMEMFLQNGVSLPAKYTEEEIELIL